MGCGAHRPDRGAGASLDRNEVIDLTGFQDVLRYLGELPPILTYAVIGVGAGVENFFPPLPADTFVLVGAFIAAEGRATVAGVFLVTWSFNVGTALIVYGLSRSWGPDFFKTTAGHWLLRPRQLERLSMLYDRHGFKIIFLSRFLPGFRALVPVFAGVGGLRFWRTVLPLALASAMWYGLLIYLGTLARSHLDEILGLLNRLNSVLLILTLILGAALGALWWRTRHHPHQTASGGGEREG